MKSNFIVVLLISLYILLPIVLYRVHHWRMAQFCYYMSVSSNCRKFFCYMLLLSALFFHFVYFNSYNKEWGLMVSTLPMLLMFSIKWQQWFLERLRDRRKELWSFTVWTLLAAITPHMFTLGVTFAILIVGVAFYPSRTIRGVDPHFISEAYSRVMITRDYRKFISCYFE